MMVDEAVAFALADLKTLTGVPYIVGGLETRSFMIQMTKNLVMSVMCPLRSLRVSLMGLYRQLA